MSRRPELPRRPAIPVTLHALAVLVVTIRAVLSERRNDDVFRALGCVAALMAVVLLVYVARKGSEGHLFGVAVVLLMAFVVGVALALRAQCVGDDFLRACTSTPVSTWQLRIVSEPTRKDDEYRCRATMYDQNRCHGDVWLTCAQRYEPGTVVQGVGRFQPNQDDEWGISSRIQGVWGSVRIVRVGEVSVPAGPLKHVLETRDAFLAQIQADSCAQRALLAGCVCGWKDGLSQYDLQDLFARCGISHLVAVSGSHMSVLCMMAGTLLEAFRVRPRMRVAFLGGLCVLFVAACGFPASAVRALVMCLSAMCARLVGRRSHALSGVALAGLVMVLVDPFVAGQTGFILSIAAVGGLCVFSPYAQYVLDAMTYRRSNGHILPRRIAQTLARLGRAGKESLAASVVAQVVTAPIAIESFGEVSLIGPFVGAVASVPFMLLMSVGVGAFVFGWLPPVQSILLCVCDVLLELMLTMARSMAHLPFACVRVSSDERWSGWLVWIALALLLLLWPNVRRRAMLGAGAGIVATFVLLMFSWRYLAEPRICVLDVGQGDAILIQEGGSAVLVDTGPGDAVQEALARNHILHLDAVILTHLHEDHYGGISSLVGSVSCDTVIVARGVVSNMPKELAQACDDLAKEGVQDIAYGDALHVGNYELRVVWPTEPVSGTENADSVELVVQYERGSVVFDGLLTGDAERDQLAELIAAVDVGDIDFLKVGHHGSDASIDAEQAIALDPEVSVASAGENNSYGHPTEACMQALEQAGSFFLCTKDVGDVEICPKEEGPSVRYARNPTQVWDQFANL